MLTTALGLSLTVAQGTLADSTRDPAERRAAVALSERLVSADGPLTLRGNVLDRRAVDRLDADRLEALFPVARGLDVRVRLGGRVLAETGDPDGGVTVRRVVLLADRQPRSLTARFTGPNASVTLPRRSHAVVVDVDPPPATTVRTVRANGRVVLHNASGLRGRFRVAVSRLETVRLSVEAAGPLPPGSVDVTYFPARTTKAVLAVTVDG